MPGQPIPMELHRRNSSHGESRTTKRVRASKPKVKSGCITCKTRRVKCDESKPSCLRCKKFGRVCDGYPGLLSGTVITTVPIQPRISSTSIYGPNIYIHSTEDENRYFQHFVDHSTKELSGFLDSSFWTQIVLQEALVVPPIRHATIAIGALSKSLENAPGPELKVNIIQKVDFKHHEAAVTQYLKAIQALNNHITASEDPQIRTALVACLLFVCFEILQGSFASAIQQTYGGLKILQDHFEGVAGSKQWMPRKSSTKSSSRFALLGKISEAPQSRLHRDNVSKTRKNTVHLEERSDLDAFQPDSVGNINIISAAFTYDPNFEKRDLSQSMIKTTVAEEEQRMKTQLPARKRSIHTAGLTGHYNSEFKASTEDSEAIRRSSSTFSVPNSLQRSSAASSSILDGEPSFTSAARKASSAFSYSSISTPMTSTPPSTGSHSPSPSFASVLPPSSSSQTQPIPQALTDARIAHLPYTSRSPSPPPLHNGLIIEGILVQMFVRLDVQGLFFGLTPNIPPLMWDVHKLWHIPVPHSFPDFTSAHLCWDFLMDRTLQFYRRTSYNRAYAPDNLDSPEQIASDLLSYSNELNAFESAFQPILDQAIAVDGVIVDHRALLLSLYQKITVITLASIPRDSEMVYDSYLPDFKQIVRTCALLISSHSTTQNPLNPRFTFEVGIVPPLHVVATKCRDPAVRREAVDLLFASPRQEGMWDSVLAARIAKWMTSCEEEGLGEPTMDRLPNSSVSQASEAEKRGSEGPSLPSSWPVQRRSASVEKRKNMAQGLVKISGSFDVEGTFPNNSAALTPGEGTGGKREKSVEDPNGKRVIGAGWIVPEKNRLRLRDVDFHISERFIKVKCQKVLPGPDARREERETIIAW